MTTTTYTVDRATHNHTRFSVTRTLANGTKQTLTVSYAKRGMNVKHDGELLDAKRYAKVYSNVAKTVSDWLTERNLAVGSPSVKVKAERTSKAKETPAYKAIPYRELQRQLKAYRQTCRVESAQLSVPLNSKHETLYDEYMRLGLGRNGSAVHYLNVKPMLGVDHPECGVGQLAKAA